MITLNPRAMRKIEFTDNDVRRTSVNLDLVTHVEDEAYPDNADHDEVVFRPVSGASVMCRLRTREQYHAALAKVVEALREPL